MNANYISVADLQDVYASDLDYTGLSETTLSGLISSASRMVDRITGATKGWDFETSVTDNLESGKDVYVDRDSNLHIVTTKRPVFGVNNVTSIKIKLGSSSTTLTLTSSGASILHIPEPKTKIIYPGSFLTSTGTILGTARLYELRSYNFFVEVIYDGGYQEIPEDMKYATALLVRDMIAKKYNPTGATEVRQGSMAVKYASRKGDQNPLVMQARELLQDYIRVS